MHFSSLLSVLTLSLSTFVDAQQFAGTTVNNSLPWVYGAELAYFNIKDENRKNATLINYSSTGSQGQRLNSQDVKRAVIFIHGQLRDPWLYAQNILTAFSTRDSSRTDITLDNVQMVMPYFANGRPTDYNARVHALIMLQVTIRTSAFPGTPISRLRSRLVIAWSGKVGSFKPLKILDTYSFSGSGWMRGDATQYPTGKKVNNACLGS
jgi:hypothetical protein